MKRIAVNGAPLTWPDSGIKFYAIALLRELANRKDEFFYQVFLPEAVEIDFKTDKVAVTILPYKKIFPAKFQYLNRAIWEIFQLPRAVRRSQADIFFTPHQAKSFLSYGAPTVIVVHDTLQWSRDIEERDIGRQSIYSLYKQGVKRASKIVTISETSQHDIVDSIGKNASDIVVAYEGIDQLFYETPSTTELNEVLSGHGLKDKGYFLYVGGFHGRKNILGVVRAFAAYLKKYQDSSHSLVIVGKPARKGPGITDPAVIQELIKREGITDRVKFIEVADRIELRAVYRGAKLFLYLSYYEGFGLPPLEAYSQGVPAVVSNRSSLPEVVGSSASLIDPDNIAGIADLMQKIISDQSFADEIVRLGQNRVQYFSWEKTASAILAVFNEIR
jgi:glycosyltransferase involved in cell wall biosynthesis